jgi:hypothetical protein
LCNQFGSNAGLVNLGKEPLPELGGQRLPIRSRVTTALDKEPAVLQGMIETLYLIAGGGSG